MFLGGPALEGRPCCGWYQRSFLVTQGNRPLTACGLSAHRWTGMCVGFSVRFSSHFSGKRAQECRHWVARTVRASFVNKCPYSVRVSRISRSCQQRGEGRVSLHPHLDVLTGVDMHALVSTLSTRLTPGTSAARDQQRPPRRACVGWPALGPLRGQSLAHGPSEAQPAHIRSWAQEAAGPQRGVGHLRLGLPGSVPQPANANPGSTGNPRTF